MLSGLEEFVAACRAAGVPKHQITARRVLLSEDTKVIDQEPAVWPFRGRVRLVVTSPPYPGVHVLYHRWQYRGRKETAAPYIIANVSDGSGESFYTFGDRKTAGLPTYFATLEESFGAIRPLLALDALVVQLVAFAEPRRHLPRYLAAMEAAGYEEVGAGTRAAARMRRSVPHRKWYAKLKEQLGGSSELLLVHRIAR
jgi:hypothetical protein